MKEIFINVDAYNSDFIKTIQDNNNAEVYKIYVLFNKRRIDLNGKTVKMAYLRTGTVEGDVINLEVTNAQEGEITLQITNAISKRDGVYSCQLAIYGADEFLEHTATFGLTVEANIFNQIANEIADSKDFTYLENILDKASKLSEKLKENTATATNANSNLESNITESNNINSKLLENTSTATSLNKNLESNIDLAKEVKETIKDLDTKNIEATEKIETLTGLNAKATELSNNIQQGLPLNSELIKNTESAKVANTNLLATNQEATTKNTELQASLEKTKEFIEGLDGSQNIPQIRMDVTELQNGLKSNQALAYKGFSVVADNTLEGRTEGMKIEGKTMYEKADGTYTDTWEEGVTLESFGEKEGNKISILSHGKNLCKIEEFSTIATNSSVESYSTLDKVIESNIEVDPNKTYTLSYTSTISGFNGCKLLGCNILLPEKITRHNDAYVFCTNNGGQERSQKITGFKYITITTGGSVPANIIKVGETINIVPQLEEGSISTTYEPYKQDKKDILIKEPLRSVNDVKDIMYEDNGQVKIDRYIKQYTFNGDEEYISINMSYNTESMAVFSIVSDVFNDKKEVSRQYDATSLFCNKFLCGSWFDIYSSKVSKEMIASSTDNNSVIYFKILKSKLTTPDVNGFKAWLKANPTTIVYQLATPVVEIVENCVDIDLDTFGEKTYFNILNSLPGTLDFKVPSNIGSSLQNLAKEVNNIWYVINNLLVPSLIETNKNIAMATIKNNLK